MLLLVPNLRKKMCNHVNSLSHAVQHDHTQLHEKIVILRKLLMYITTPIDLACINRILVIKYIRLICMNNAYSNIYSVQLINVGTKHCV